MNFDELFDNLNLSTILNYSKENDTVYKIKAQGKKNEWNIQINLESFPYTLPKAYLLDEDFIGTLAHVNENGVICLEESDSIIINYNEQLDILYHFIVKIIELLNDKNNLISQDELKDEFEGYFQNNLKYLNSFYFAQDKIEEVALEIAKESYSTRCKPILLYDDNLNLPKDYSNVNSVNKQKINILHIPLEIAVLPPSKKMLQDLYKYIQSLYEYISKDYKEFIDSFLNKKKPNYNFYLLFSLPRTEAERTQFLVHYHFKTKVEHPLKNSLAPVEIELYFLNRNNETYLKERGGANNNLSSKKVSIIGCGSVGSEISFMLAKAGIGELTLIDPDIFSHDNIFRHRLGGNSLNYIPNEQLKVGNGSKVSLLERQIKKDIPYIKINARRKFFRDILDDKKLLGSDVIVVAVGSPMVNIDINMKLKELGLNKVIFCWNEADSVGGHSVALDLKESCFECLYTDDNGFSTDNELSFIKTEQNISKNIIGCAGVFTPFSYLDSSQTALLASRQCIEMLNSTLHSQALSWKTTGSVRLDVTQRFNDSNFQELKELGRKTKCRVCSG